MATNCSMPNSQLKHDEWMTNLPVNLHNEPITKIAIPGRNTLRNHKINFQLIFRYT
jgi:hypothetical protein